MDYEKKYKEALERAKEYLKEYYFEEAVKEIFPELKEPEDEKVRKALIEMVHDINGNKLRFDYNVHKEEVLAWLEKQGEQKPIEWDEYDEMYISALIAIVRKEDATTPNLRDTLTGWLRCLKNRFKKDKL